MEDVLEVESPRKGHLRWPALDIDLHVECLKNPAGYPLVAKVELKPKKNLRIPKTVTSSKGLE